eukprot:TRINITY_DN20574_c0_g1_i1.p1 TRINITY_DN20574_c0_g1~~TRINITY_DN20574_c0_g1_i1.p1  ORF type:complete len:150 (+),score=14.40 TRINITY_DN20574_c0_g1_i1:37-486(+)
MAQGTAVQRGASEVTCNVNLLMSESSRNSSISRAGMEMVGTGHGWEPWRPFGDELSVLERRLVELRGSAAAQRQQIGTSLQVASELNRVRVGHEETVATAASRASLLQARLASPDPRPPHALHHDLYTQAMQANAHRRTEYDVLLRTLL